MKHGRREPTLEAILFNRLSLLAFLVVVLPVHVRSQSANDAIVYLDSLRQNISGFGANNILPWRPDMTASQRQKAFGTGDGELGFSLLRLRLPSQASEFSLNVATAQAAHAMGVKVFASPWSPPAALKTNNNIVGGELRDTSYDDYAAHMKSFVDYMAGNGVPLFAVSVQNEPDISVSYESCDWNSDQMLRFVKENGEDVGTDLIAPESFNFNPTMANAILSDSGATANVDIIGGHIYGGGLVPYPPAAAKGKEMWMTEHLVLDTSWTAVLATGKEIHDVMNAGMSAYVWWYIVRFYGPISENGDVSKRGYVMSQYARFIRPGADRVLTTIPRSSVYVTAYSSPSRIVVIAINMGSATAQQSFWFENLPGDITSFTRYVTTRVKNCEQAGPVMVSGGSFTATLEDSSVTTFVADISTSTGEETRIPESIELFQNFPNPFNPSTLIRYSLPGPMPVSLKVYNLLGQEVTTLYEGQKSAGTHEARFEASGLPGGIYFARMSAGKMLMTQRMILIQ